MHRHFIYCLSIHLSLFTACQSDSYKGAPWTLVDIGHDAGIQDQYKRNRGAGGVDFDLDGDVDILLTNPYEPPTLLINNGNSTFTTLDFPTTGRDTAPAIADFDGDGDLDVFLSCGGWREACLDKLIRNDGLTPEGQLIWTDATHLLNLNATHFDARSAFGATWVDWDRDGDLDLHVAVKDNDEDCGEFTRPNGTCELTEDFFFRNDREDGFENIAATIGIDSTHHSHQAAWLDYDLDGDMDLYIPVYGDNNHLYRNNGDGTFKDVTSSMGLILQSPLAAFGAVSEDFNHDGYPDLLVVAFSIVDDYMLEDGNKWDFAPEPHRLFINDNGRGFVEGTPNTTRVDLRMPTMGFQVGDIDLDSHWDVFFGNGNPLSGYQNGLYSIKPKANNFHWIDHSHLIDHPAPEDTSISDSIATYPYRSHGTVFDDFDGDGDIDLFIGNGGAHKLDFLADADDPTLFSQREPNRLFRNDTISEVGWLDITVVGQDWNLFAIGTQVTIRSESDPTWVRSHVVRSNSGFNSSRRSLPRIGLGNEQGPFTVDVSFTSGVRRTVEHIEANSALNIEE